MNYRTVRDILHLVRTYHGRLSDLLQHVVQNSADELALPVTDAMQRHEQHWRVALAGFESDNGQPILNAWVQFVPTETLDAQLKSAFAAPAALPQDAQQMVIAFHQAMSEFYGTLAAQVSAPRVRELFNSLMQMERSLTKHIAWQTRRW